MKYFKFYERKCEYIEFRNRHFKSRKRLNLSRKSTVDTNLFQDIDED